MGDSMVTLFEGIHRLNVAFKSTTISKDNKTRLFMSFVRDAHQRIEGVNPDVDQINSTTPIDGQALRSSLEELIKVIDSLLQQYDQQTLENKQIIAEHLININEVMSVVIINKILPPLFLSRLQKESMRILDSRAIKEQFLDKILEDLVPDVVKTTLSYPKETDHVKDRFLKFITQNIETKEVFLRIFGTNYPGALGGKTIGKEDQRGYGLPLSNDGTNLEAVEKILDQDYIQSVNFSAKTEDEQFIFSHRQLTGMQEVLTAAKAKGSSLDIKENDAVMKDIASSLLLICIALDPKKAEEYKEKLDKAEKENVRSTGGRTLVSTHTTPRINEIEGLSLIDIKKAIELHEKFAQKGVMPESTVPDVKKEDSKFIPPKTNSWTEMRPIFEGAEGVPAFLVRAEGVKIEALEATIESQLKLNFDKARDSESLGGSLKKVFLNNTHALTTEQKIALREQQLIINVETMNQKARLAYNAQDQKIVGLGDTKAIAVDMALDNLLSKVLHGKNSENYYLVPDSCSDLQDFARSWVRNQVNNLKDAEVVSYLCGKDPAKASSGAMGLGAQHPLENSLEEMTKTIQTSYLTISENNPEVVFRKPKYNLETELVRKKMKEGDAPSLVEHHVSLKDAMQGLKHSIATSNRVNNPKPLHISDKKLEAALKVQVLGHASSKQERKNWKKHITPDDINQTLQQLGVKGYQGVSKDLQEYQNKNQTYKQVKKKLKDAHVKVKDVKSELGADNDKKHWKEKITREKLDQAKSKKRE